MKFIDMSISDYSDQLYSKEAIPGGGSVAALSTSLAVDLIAMVINISLTGEKYKEHHDDLNKNLFYLDKIRMDNRLLIDSDSEAYSQVIKSYKISKEKSEEKYREIDKAYKKAADVPYKVMVNAYNALKVINETCTIVNKNVLTDYYAAIFLIESSIKTSLFNIESNLFYIKDENFKEKLILKTEKLIKLTNIYIDEIGTKLGIKFSDILY